MPTHLAVSAAIRDFATFRFPLRAAGFIGLCSGLTALILVLPVLLAIPRVRLLPFWAAALWGLAIALLIALAARLLLRSQTC